MSRHNIGDQFIETMTDGKRHMIKLVELHNYDNEACSGCDFFSAGTIRMHDSKQHGSMKYVHPMCNLHCSPGLGLRDLGVVDENGLLPCPVKTEDPFKPFFGKAGYRDGYSWQGWKACQPIVVNGTAVGEPSAHEGISRRDFFAGCALMGLLSNYGLRDNSAEKALSLADEMIKECAKEENDERSNL